ncbi:TPA: dATP/dGTP pyrophosphohydrolase domain-containing protein [Salmonella enterica subsp. enterica serovar Mississippi]
MDEIGELQEREQIRREHAEWSDAIFGDVGPIGPLKHLSKEALEAAANPEDPLEWADMQFLLWDAQRRMGLSDEFITRAMIEKLAINKARQWPEPKDGEPRLHIKEQPVLVATGATYSGFEDFWSACKHPFAQDDELKDVSWVIWNACRAALLQSKYRDLSQPVDPQISEYEKIMLQAGNSPVTPDGWISCSERMPAQDDWVLIYSKHGEYLAGQVQGEYVELNDGTLSWLGSALHWMLLPEPPQEVK